MSHQIQDTSLDAYYGAVIGNLGNKQMQVLRIFAKNLHRDYTNAELANELHWPINTVTPRVYEMRGLDKHTPIDPNNPILVEYGRRNCSITHMKAIAWGMNPNYRKFQDSWR